ncbi:hypothetical protein V6N13_083121 [Hibiscus sabdariffa]|uniref:Uncharacterized protein n=1 Tax=Hibiscus sabdariffa TaxID=183260 RepID=A0ABR2SX25_9ROSI
MWSLLCLAWCWFVTLTWSADARCGQPWCSCCALPVSIGVPMMLAALLLADFWDAGLWTLTPVPLRCLMAFATPLFRSHALLVSVGIPMMLAAVLLIFAVLIRPLAEVYSCSLLPSWLCLGGSFHPLPLPCSRLGDASCV